MPTGAHICVICQIPVHAIKECSVAYDKEEGYGQKRICVSCSVLKNSEEVLAMQKTENWRGLNDEKKKRTARYLGQNKHNIQDSLTWSKSTKLPIIKNGNTMKLQAVCLEGTNYSLTNTCAFDSLLQILLVTLSDYKHFADKIRATENPLFEMANDILAKGIRAHTYKLRAQILKAIFLKEDQIMDPIIEFCVQINCETNVGHLAGLFFKNTPSFEEESICDMGCPPRKKILPVAQIDSKIILEDNFYNVVNEHIILLGKKKCYRKNCPGFETTSLHKIGSIVLFDVCNFGTKTEPIKLQDIPNTIKNPLNQENDLKLIGIVDYKKPPMLTRGSDTDKCTGHYTAITRRSENWIEYNDLQVAEKK
ncbi:uncharacterized protein LOC143896052 [Temnothorax americanus]|uniref:uncharacterized protein LOC143896052 n=1 Tax=Temnothorax americanus TaxID=1964332 RepID=UPI004067F97C